MISMKHEYSEKYKEGAFIIYVGDPQTPHYFQRSFFYGEEEWQQTITSAGEQAAAFADGAVTMLDVIKYQLPSTPTNEVYRISKKIGDICEKKGVV